MANAFISFISAIVQDIYGSFGKLASILFERLIIQVPDNNFLESILDKQVIRKKLDIKIAEQLKEVWLPVYTFFPEYKFLGNPWEHENARLLKIAEDVTIEATKKQYPEIGENDYGFQREVAWAGAVLIDAVITWNCLHAKFPCSILADSRERQVIEQVFRLNQPPEEMKMFREVTENEIPDLGALSWERVFELRNSPFLNNFRSKISELLDLTRNNDKKSASEILKEIEVRDLRDLAKLVEPSLKKMIIKSIVCNIPLPIPINPLSIGFGYKDVKDAFDRKDRFGWLYFLMELRS